jgi:hypothetical protein
MTAERVQPGGAGVRLEGNRLHICERFSVSFQRTLRIPDDGGEYPLPPGLGVLPVEAVEKYSERAPESWRPGDLFIPMYQREALWLGFDAAPWKPNAVKVGIGGIDAISGDAWSPALQAEPQNYIVCPDQPWLDGINAGNGMIRQFVAMPLGSGYTVEGQLTGEERVGGIQLLVFEPKPGRFPDRPAPKKDEGMPMEMFAPSLGPMGLAAGGRMKQVIHKDRYGLDTWDARQSTEVLIHIVNCAEWEAITGRAAPPTPVSPRTYTEHGLPWFAIYDESGTDIPASSRFERVKSMGDLDEAASGRRSDDDAPISVPERQVRKLKKKPS